MMIDDRASAGALKEELLSSLDRWRATLPSEEAPGNTMFLGIADRAITIASSLIRATVDTLMADAPLPERPTMGMRIGVIERCGQKLRVTCSGPSGRLVTKPDIGVLHRFTRLAALSASIRGMLQIVEVEPLTARIVRLTLSDGSVVDRDLADVLWGPVFERIAREDAVFREVHVRNGTIAWSEEADLAPETVIWGTWPPRQGQRPPTTMRVPNLTD